MIKWTTRKKETKVRGGKTQTKRTRSPSSGCCFLLYLVKKTKIKNPRVSIPYYKHWSLNCNCTCTAHRICVLCHATPTLLSQHPAGFSGDTNPRLSSQNPWKPRKRRARLHLALRRQAAHAPLSQTTTYSSFGHNSGSHPSLSVIQRCSPQPLQDTPVCLLIELCCLPACLPACLSVCLFAVHSLTRTGRPPADASKCTASPISITSATRPNLHAAGLLLLLPLMQSYP